MPPPGRPRISTGVHESKTLALYNSGRALLAEQDYDAFSVAQVAKLAGCSVGAFYVRFPDKNDFLYFVIRHSFDLATQAFSNALTKSGVKAIGLQAKARLAVPLLIEQFADAEFAGGVRAAVKLGFSESMYRLPLDQYREAVTDHLAQWLYVDRSKHNPHIRSALQIVLGTLTDAALSSDSTKSLRSGGLESALAFLLENAASSAIKSGAKTEPKKSSKSMDRNPHPVSVLKKPSETVTKKAEKKLASIPPPQMSPHISPTRRVRKV